MKNIKPMAMQCNFPENTNSMIFHKPTCYTYSYYSTHWIL